jgi:DNA-binding transcriptional LysR family regulator
MTMPDPRSAAFDLNLLAVFDALMQERSVTRAAGRVGLSQPAMSHALNRLRHMLEDELFIRTPDGMMPTPRAEQLALPLRKALNEMQLALEPEIFIPAAADRAFALAINNYAAVVLAPPLAAAVAKAAPGVRLDLRPSGTLDIVTALDRAALDRDALDLALGHFESAGDRFESKVILEDSFVFVMRRGHPAGRRPLSPATLAALAHIDISSAPDFSGSVDRWLADNGVSRRVTLRAPYLSAGKLLAQSDRVAALSRRVALSLVESHPLQMREPPFASPVIRTTMLWHRRLDSHPAHRWLRDMVSSAAKSLCAVSDMR